ncbi:MAG: hypothetical protein CR979_03810 [Propionibacterium sp.]|nr:MAG: hypothetical protein CR979_03810 [Propionibacterium sp.]
MIKAQVGNQICYIKVLRPGAFDDVLARHNLLTSAGLPSPQVLAATDDQLLITRQLPGTALARAVFDPEEPCSAEQLIGLLDAMPEQVTQLPRRMSWSDALEQYADMVIEVLPSQQPRLDWLVTQIGSGLRGVPKGNEPTHGDFHEGQIHVSGKQIVGILDVDTIGPGRRADDLACLIAHLSTIQGMNPEQEARIRALLANWVPVFDERVDPVELRLRTAAVIISLATGPYRNQEADWQTQTSTILGAATALIRQIV